MNGNGRPKAATQTLAGSAESVEPLADTPAQLRRRRRASWRLPPALDDGHRDPHHLPDDDDLSAGALVAWGMAIDHLLEAGMCPVVPVAVRRARRSVA